MEAELIVKVKAAQSSGCVEKCSNNTSSCFFALCGMIDMLSILWGKKQHCTTLCIVNPSLKREAVHYQSHDRLHRQPFTCLIYTTGISKTLLKQKWIQYILQYPCTGSDHDLGRNTYSRVNNYKLVAVMGNTAVYSTGSLSYLDPKYSLFFPKPL